MTDQALYFKCKLIKVKRETSSSASLCDRVPSAQEPEAEAGTGQHSMGCVPHLGGTGVDPVIPVGALATGS